jgi:hypothetical protein
MKVLIKEVASGEIREWAGGSDLEWSGEFIWSEGNFACDCNRRDFFHENDVGYDPEAEGNDKCGDSAFVVRITDSAGSLLYEDEAWPVLPPSP